MRIAVTGATGFIGRYIVQQLLDSGYDCRCCCRTGSNRQGFGEQIEWCETELNDGRGRVPVGLRRR